jgi:hypothetical protein
MSTETAITHPQCHLASSNTSHYTMKVLDNKLHALNWSLTSLTEQNRISDGGDGGGDSFVTVLDNSSQRYRF